MTWTLTIPGKPKTKGNSARVMRRGGHLSVSPSASSQAAEYAARTVIAAHAPLEPIVGLVRCDVEFRFAIPKAARAGKRKPATLHPGDPCGKAVDRGNLLKLIEDAMNGLVYVDDSQVVGGDARKIWWDRDETWVRVTEIRRPDAEIPARETDD